MKMMKLSSKPSSDHSTADSIATAISTNKGRQRFQRITFVRNGEKSRPQQGQKAGLLSTATDWHLEVDLGQQFKSQPTITPAAHDQRFFLHQAADPAGVDCILGRTHGPGQQEEACQEL